MLPFNIQTVKSHLPVHLQENSAKELYVQKSYKHPETGKNVVIRKPASQDRNHHEALVKTDIEVDSGSSVQFNQSAISTKINYKFDKTISRIKKIYAVVDVTNGSGVNPVTVNAARMLTELTYSFGNKRFPTYYADNLEFEMAIDHENEAQYMLAGQNGLDSAWLPVVIPAGGSKKFYIDITTVFRAVSVHLHSLVDELRVEYSLNAYDDFLEAGGSLVLNTQHIMAEYVLDDSDTIHGAVHGDTAPIVYSFVAPSHRLPEEPISGLAEKSRLKLDATGESAFLLLIPRSAASVNEAADVATVSSYAKLNDSHGRRVLSNNDNPLTLEELQQILAEQSPRNTLLFVKNWVILPTCWDFTSVMNSGNMSGSLMLDRSGNNSITFKSNDAATTKLNWYLYNYLEMQVRGGRVEFIRDVVA